MGSGRWLLTTLPLWAFSELMQSVLAVVPASSPPILKAVHLSCLRLANQTKPPLATCRCPNYKNPADYYMR